MKFFMNFIRKSIGTLDIFFSQWYNQDTDVKIYEEVIIMSLKMKYLRLLGWSGVSRDGQSIAQWDPRVADAVLSPCTAMLPCRNSWGSAIQSSPHARISRAKQRRQSQMLMPWFYSGDNWNLKHSATLLLFPWPWLQMCGCSVSCIAGIITSFFFCLFCF